MRSWKLRREVRINNQSGRRPASTQTIGRHSNRRSVQPITTRPDEARQDEQGQTCRRLQRKTKASGTKWPISFCKQQVNRQDQINDCERAAPWPCSGGKGTAPSRQAMPAATRARNECDNESRTSNRKRLRALAKMSRGYFGAQIADRQTR